MDKGKVIIGILFLISVLSLGGMSSGSSLSALVFFLIAWVAALKRTASLRRRGWVLALLFFPIAAIPAYVLFGPTASHPLIGPPREGRGDSTAISIPQKGREDSTVAADADYYYQQGDTDLKVSDWDRAIANFTQAINLNPNNADYFWRRAEACIERQTAYDRKGDAQASEWDRYRSGFGFYRRIFLNKDYAHQAVADLTNAIRLNPSNCLYYHALAIGWLQLKDMHEARDAARRCIELDGSLSPELEKALRESL